MDKFTQKLERLGDRVLQNSEDKIAFDMFNELYEFADYIEEMAIQTKQQFIEDLAASQKLRYNCTQLINKIRRNRHG